MPFTQFVEVGRLALVSFGELSGKLAVIVDIVDHNRVVVDVAEGETRRQVMNVKRLKLTDMVANISRAAPADAVRAVVEKDGLLSKFNETKWGMRLNKESSRVQLSDFQRFKHAKLVAKRNELVQAALSQH